MAEAPEDTDADESSISTLPAVECWDGSRSIGPARLSWSRRGTDAVITDVRPAERVDPGWEGLCILPGLIDTHVHLIGDAHPHPAGDFLAWPVVTPREQQVLHGLSHAQRALRSGVTTLRDLSADRAQVALGAAVRDELITGPRILAYGMVSMTAGHGDLFYPPALRDRPPTADGADECRKLVRMWARDGLDGIKVATSGGVLSSGDRAAWRNHSPQELAAIVDEAHALQMRVAAHAHTEAGIEAALQAGVDSVEHATLITGQQASVVAERGLTVAPTLLINDAIAEGRVPVSDEQRGKAAELVAVRDERLVRAAAIGVEFVLGTDANGFHVRFGDEHEEVRRMAHLFGWSPERALQAATSRAAAALGFADRIGSLTAGMAADFVVLHGRPWERLGDLDAANVVAVVARGRLVVGRLPGSGLLEDGRSVGTAR